MARSIAIIKAGITTDFMANETLATAYGFTTGATFDDEFSKVSIESLIFFIVATAIWLLETLFDTHKTELTALIETKAHGRLWYKNKVLAFQYGRSLLPDSDTYDQVVESEKIVKYCSVVEYQGRIYIKVAKGIAIKEPLTNDEQTALEEYISEVKDGGVVIGDVPGSTTVTNLAADHFSAELDIYFDPMVYAASGLRLDSGADTVRDTIKDFVQNQIPFNGEYRNASLVDVLQALDGVVIPEFLSAKSKAEDSDWTVINAKCLPVSGYFKVYEDVDLVLNFKAYQTIESI